MSVQRKWKKWWCNERGKNWIKNRKRILELKQFHVIMKGNLKGKYIQFPCELVEFFVLCLTWDWKKRKTKKGIQNTVMINNNEVSCLFNYHIVLFSKWGLTAFMYNCCNKLAILYSKNIKTKKLKCLIHNWVNNTYCLCYGSRVGSQVTYNLQWNRTFKWVK